MQQGYRFRFILLGQPQELVRVVVAVSEAQAVAEMVADLSEDYPDDLITADGSVVRAFSRDEIVWKLESVGCTRCGRQTVDWLNGRTFSICRDCCYGHEGVIRPDGLMVCNHCGLEEDMELPAFPSEGLSVRVTPATVRFLDSLGITITRTTLRLDAAREILRRAKDWDLDTSAQRKPVRQDVIRLERLVRDWSVQIEAAPLEWRGRPILPVAGGQDEQTSYFGVCPSCGSADRFLTFDIGGQPACSLCADQASVDDVPTTRRAFAIPEANLADLNASVAKMGRKAEKLHLDAPGLLDLGHVDVPGEGDTLERFYLVNVTGPRLSLAGWTFAATIENAGEAGNLLRTVPGEADLPERFRTAGATCDHCHTVRFRRETFVVRSETGEYRQVGRQCLADFLGGVSPSGVLAGLEWLKSLSGVLEGFETRGSRGLLRRDRDSFLASVAAHIRVLGWKSRTAAREDDSSATVDLVLSTLNPFHRHQHGKPSCYTRSGVDMHPATTDADKAEAAAALAWFASDVASKDELSDYEWNLKVCLATEALPEKGLGLAASLISGYQREMGRQAERKARETIGADSQHVGTVGKRLETTVTVLSLRNFESQYGTKVLHTLQDADGNLLKWWATGEPLNEGETVRIKGTVKSHDVYQGRQETTLTRVDRILDVATASTFETTYRAAASAAAEARLAEQEAQARAEADAQADGITTTQWTVYSAYVTERTAATRQAASETLSQRRRLEFAATKPERKILARVDAEIEARADLIERRRRLEIAAEVRANADLARRAEATRQVSEQTAPGTLMAEQAAQHAQDTQAKLATSLAEAASLAVAVSVQTTLQPADIEQAAYYVNSDRVNAQATLSAASRSLVLAEALADQNPSGYAFALQEWTAAQAKAQRVGLDTSLDRLDIARGWLRVERERLAGLEADYPTLATAYSGWGSERLRAEGSNQRSQAEARAKIAALEPYLARLEADQPAVDLPSLADAETAYRAAWLPYTQYLEDLEAHYSTSTYLRDHPDVPAIRDAYHRAEVLLRLAGGDRVSLDQQLQADRAASVSAELPDALRLAREAWRDLSATLDVVDSLGPDSSPADRQAAVELGHEAVTVWQAAPKHYAAVHHEGQRLGIVPSSLSIEEAVQPTTVGI